jgi:uncharacterized protein (DUF927 family)
MFVRDINLCLRLFQEVIMTNKESTSEEIDPSKVQAERKEKIKDILGKLSPTKKDKAYASLNGEQRFEEILISRYFNNKDDIVAILIDIDNQRKSEVQAAKQAQEKAQAEEKLALEKLIADMNRIPAILRNDFSLTDVQANEILSIINSNINTRVSAQEYLVKDILPSQGTKSISFDSLKSAMNNHINSYYGNAGNAAVNDWIYDGKVKPLFYDADTYRMTKNETSKIIHGKDKKNTHYETICYSSVAITKKQENNDDGKIYLTAEFLTTSGERKSLVLPMNELCSSKGIPKLVGCGLNVPEKQYSNCGELFMNIAMLNDRNIVNERIYNTWGWKDDCSKFFIGRSLYSLDSEGNLKSEPATMMRYNKEKADALTPHGTLENWFRGMKLMLGYDNVRFSSYVSSGSILLYPLNQKSKLWDSYGLSGIGKTARGEAAASQYGRSSDDPGGLTVTMNSTDTSFENDAAEYNHIPLNIDDAQTNDGKQLNHKVMMFGNQRGKGRGQKDGGNRKLQTWCSFCFSSSETPIHSDSTNEGALVRGFDLHGGITDKKEDDALHAYNVFKTIQNTDYGLIAPILIEKILRIRKNGNLNKVYEEKKAELRNAYMTANPGTKDSDIGRVLDSFAIVSLGASLFEEIMKEHNQPTKDYLPLIVKRMKEIVSMVNNQSLRALEYIYDWINEDKRNFKVNNQWAAGSANLQMYGNYNFVKQEIQINKKSLEEKLVKAGFTLEKTLRTLSTDYEGIIKFKTENGNVCKLGTNGERCIVINAKAVEDKIKLANPFIDAPNIDNSETVRKIKIINDEGQDTNIND